MSISSIGTPEPEPEVEQAVTEQPEVKDGQGVVEVEEGENKPELTLAPSNPVLEAILNKITPVTETRPTLKVLIYSDPGMGKSTLLGTATNNLIIDVEQGLASLNNHPDLLADNVKVIPYKTFDGLELIVDTLAQRPDELSDIETLSIDSASELHKRGLAEVTDREWRRNPISNNRYVAETEQHTENNEHIRRLVSSLRDLPLNLILTAHSRTIEPKGRPSKTFPDFSEKLANTLAGIMDIVGYMYMKEVDGEMRRILRLHSDGNITAKTRIGGYPEEMIDPSWPKLWDVHQRALLANKK